MHDAGDLRQRHRTGGCAAQLTNVTPHNLGKRAGGEEIRIANANDVMAGHCALNCFFFVWLLWIVIEVGGGDT